MTVTIKNLGLRPISIVLESRRALHLASGVSVSGIEEAEVAGNAKIANLQAMRAISVETASRTMPGESGTPSGASSPEKESPSGAKPRR